MALFALLPRYESDMLMDSVDDGCRPLSRYFGQMHGGTLHRDDLMMAKTEAW